MRKSTGLGKPVVLWNWFESPLYLTTMPGTIESNGELDRIPFDYPSDVLQGPAYISFHSADVILSDIRPIKLKAEALRSVNVLLDEFLYSILNTARSLSTDKLRAGLLRVLPTNLGKEALLEAEVELRAYWDRTSPSGSSVSPPEDDAKTFHLQWAFEVGHSLSFKLMDDS
jgi:hypothetical protein